MRCRMLVAHAIMIFSAVIGEQDVAYSLANKPEEGGRAPRCTPQEPHAPCVFPEFLLRFSVIFLTGLFP